MTIRTMNVQISEILIMVPGNKSGAPYIANRHFVWKQNHEEKSNNIEVVLFIYLFI